MDISYDNGSHQGNDIPFMAALSLGDDERYRLSPMKSTYKVQKLEQACYLTENSS